MRELRYTLACDGSSDRALLFVLNWLLRQHLPPDFALQGNCWYNTNLVVRIEQAIKLFPCELLFVHRDAEREPAANRVREIETALAALPECTTLPVVCVIPIRMTEAWLVFDEQAIRYASGNARGKAVLDTIDVRRIEELTDPKAKLKEMLRKASELKGRRLAQFEPDHARQRVAELIDDFAPLRSLSAFQQLEGDVKQIIQQQGWGETDVV